MVFDRLFGRRKKREEEPPVLFGRYSDNNKTVEQVQRWNDADTLFREKKYTESIEAFFEYLCDREQENVVVENRLAHKQFTLYQGSKVVRGKVDRHRVCAEILLARMPEPSIPVMRRLLEMNFHLYYSRCCLKGDKICMRFESDLSTASPNKLYYGLKEMSTKADKQDDLLLDEFGFLEPLDTGHITLLPPEEKEIKYDFLQNWIGSTLTLIDSLDGEKFSGAISYLLLTLVFRIDYLIAPEGKFLSELEKIASAYYGKDDGSSPERNPAMIEKFRKLQEMPKETLFRQLFRSIYTFAIVIPHNLAQVKEAIEASLENMVWYRDNNYPDIANRVMEYGFAYSQYSYSLPKPLSDLFYLFMRVNHATYFHALGFKTTYYDTIKNTFDEEEIKNRIESVVERWKKKYPQLIFKTKKLKFDSLVNFNQGFLQEVAGLNFE